LKLSVVETSTIMRDGRLARAQTIPESIDTSPDCTPWLMTGRSAARLIEGRAIPPKPLASAAEPKLVSSRRLLNPEIAMAVPAPADHGHRR
jgi:hypothetical protein